MLLQLGSSNPTLVTQWLYIMVLLDRCPIPVWAKALNTGRGRQAPVDIVFVL